MSDDRPSRAPLVGRSEVLERVLGVVGVGEAAPVSSSVLLSGDAGVGKTRLMTEVGRRAQEAGWRVMVGHCLDFRDSTLAYLPFSEMFGRLDHDTPDLSRRVLSTLPAVARLMPGRRLLGADPAADPVDRSVVIDRSHVMDSVHAAVSLLSQDAPLLVVVEDAHWADSSTRELLGLLLTRPVDGPVCVVVTYRSDDLHRRHPLRAAVAEWSRLTGVTRVQLRPLADDDVRTLVRALHPSPLTPADLEGMVDRAEGNAFFVEELVAAALAGGHRLPTDLADLLLVRLDQLDESAHELVRAASVAGRTVPDGLLARVLGRDRRDFDAAARSAVERHILVAHRDGYRFRHALLAEAVYDDLLPGERVQLHGAFADALTGGQSDGTAAELARHAREAHQPAVALAASIRAGDEAMTVGGPDEAARHYEQALELWDAVHRDSGGHADRTDGADGGTAAVDTGVPACLPVGASEPAEPVTLIDLTVRAADAVVAAGRPHRATSLIERQLGRLPDSAPAVDRARLMAALAGAALVIETGVDVLRLTSEALDLVPADPPTALRAQLAGLHALANVDRGRFDDAGRWADEAVRLAELLDLPQGLTDARTTLALLDRLAGDPDAAEQVLRQSLAVARTGGDQMAETRAWFSLGGLHFEFARLDEAQTEFLTAMERAQQMGRPWAPYGVDGRIMAGIVAHVRGDWELTSSLADVGTGSPPPLSGTIVAALGMLVDAGRGRTGALDLLPQARRWWARDPLLAGLAGGAGIDLYGDQHDLAAAVTLHDEVVSVITQVWGETSQARIRLAAVLLGQMCGAISRTGSRERGPLVDRADALFADAERVARPPSGRTLRAESQAWWRRAQAEHRRLHWIADTEAPSPRELESGWRAAVTAFEQFGHVFEVARSQARLAAVLRAGGSTGQVAEATALARTATTTARRLGAEPLLHELRASARPPVRDSRGDAFDRPVLTPRELEVLALVARGLSNGEIARHLFISTKTVSVHVSNILAKLGAGGRTEAAALGRRGGLIQDE